MAIKKLVRFSSLAIKIACIGHCINEYVFSIAFCYGPSMEPTISSSNVVICEHITQLLRDVDLGDIVISRSVNNPSVNVCKRVTGVAGDIVWTGGKFVRVPKGHVWLQGDNSRDSMDSRDYGPVPEALIKGRVALRIWPLDQFRLY